MVGPSKEELAGWGGNVTLDVAGLDNGTQRPSNIRHISAPAYESPLRHHQRKPSTPHKVKETLHARSEWSNSGDDGGSVHCINQYMIGEEIGRGSFGAVHLAKDQYGHEYAVKEFSKSRLRKRAQSHILRRPHGPDWRRAFSPGGFSSTLGPSRSPTRDDSQSNPLHLIREEIAIMKKLNHTNLVQLLEVLDDPEEDSLYMVLEMCKKGVVMKVAMHEPADPYDPESCRCWFRDLILGIEYLHAQGVAHRDIKPDNLLITEDDELKIVDFGVSEMFEKSSDFLSAKSAGSPAFLPPELCVSKHGNVSGKAADLWSMGVTLYCLYFGHVPFEKTNILELYESIRNDSVELPTDADPQFADVISRLLEKDPSKRITMRELRVHPWVTKGGTDPLMPEEENIEAIIAPPTDEELMGAITKKMGNLLVVVRAVKQFKKLLFRKRPHLMDGVLGTSARIVQPPLPLERPSAATMRLRPKSDDNMGRRPLEGALVAEGVHRINDPDIMDVFSPDRSDGAVIMTGGGKQVQAESLSKQQSPDAIISHGSITTSELPQVADPRSHRHHTRTGTPHSGRGQAHDPLTDTIFLGLGPVGEDSQDTASLGLVVSESPSADGGNIYELAYQQEIERIRKEKGRNATLYLTRRVERLRDLLGGEDVKGPAKSATLAGNERGTMLQEVASRAHGKTGQREEGEAEATEQDIEPGQGAHDKQDRASGLADLVNTVKEAIYSGTA